MITTFGIQKNKYSSIVTSESLLDDLFETVPSLLLFSTPAKHQQ